MEQLKKALSTGCTENKDFCCSLCNKILSVSPIYYCSSLGNICGRCNVENLPVKAQTENNVIERQTVYENVAKILEFPCSNHIKGCKERLSWEDVINHESSCDYKHYLCLCPFSVDKYLDDEEPKCTWEGDEVELSSHLKAKHNQNFSDPLQLCIAPEYKSNIIFNEIQDGKIIVIILDYEKSSYKYNLRIFSNLPVFECSQYMCILEMTDEDKISTVIMQQYGIQHISAGFLNGDVGKFEINIFSIKELLKKPSVTVIFNIKKCLEITSVQTSSKEGVCFNDYLKLTVEELEDEVKSRLICDKCKYLSIPPISSCKKHNICFPCKGSIRLCPLCRNSLVESDYTLNLIAAGITHYCKYKNDGCAFKGSVVELHDHKKFCSFLLRDCPLNCSWQGDIASLLPHVQETHGFFEMDRIHTAKFNSEFLSLVHFENLYFHLKFSYFEGKPFECNVFCISNQLIEYKYDFILMGPISLGVKLMFTHVCHAIKSVDIPKNVKGISIPFSFLKQFVPDRNNLQFKMTISKIKTK